MKNGFLIFVLGTILSFTISAEQLDTLLQDYGEYFDSACVEIDMILDTSKKDITYGRDFYISEEGNYLFSDIKVLRKNEVEFQLINGDTFWIPKYCELKQNEVIKRLPNLQNFPSTQRTLGIMIKTSLLPEYNKYRKNLSINEAANFLNSDKYNDLVNDFKSYSILITKAAFSLGISEVPRNPDSLEYYRKWLIAELEIEKLEIKNILRNFEIRYGEGSEKLNLLELVIVNHCFPFRGTDRGPSRFEPILRYSPVTYNLSKNDFFPMVQIGLNFYFLNDPNLFLEWLHHIGIALSFGDLETDKIYCMKNLSLGGIFHIGGYEIGAIYDSKNDKLKFLTTVNFQLIPGFF